jgi:ATP-dependent Lon protease
VHYGSALSGRDLNAVNRTVDGLLKLLYPDANVEVSDEDLEWAVHLALECRRRVKEQQKRIGSAEFRNTQFSFRIGDEGVERFVATPGLQSSVGIGLDPLPPGQVWGISPGGGGEYAGLYKIEVSEGPGSGVKIINRPVPAPLRESVHVAEQNLLARARELVGDREPRSHEFNLQLQSMDSARSGSALGLPVLLGLCSALLQRSLKGGLILSGNLTLGGGREELSNAVDLAELAAEKGAQTLLLPISSRRQLLDVSDEVATRVSFLFYSYPRDALNKALAD